MMKQTYDTVSYLIGDNATLEYVEKAKKNKLTYSFSADTNLEALYLFCQDAKNTRNILKAFERVIDGSPIGREFIKQAAVCESESGFNSIYLRALILLLNSLDDAKDSK